jgi:hypothetical protein
MDRNPTIRVRALATVAAAVMVLCAALVGTASWASALPAWQDHATSWSGATRSPKIVDLRFAAHRAFDRVVIDIVGGIPAGRAHYARRFHYDASGKLVPIGGRSGLALALSPARAHDRHGNVYEGPQVARPHLETLKALAITGDFEGTVSFGFALTHRAPYRVSFLHGPQRLVIDFKHD